MKKAVFLSLIVMLSALVAGPASATHFNNPVLEADCAGWSVSGEIVLGYESNTLTYYVELYEGMTLVEEYSGSEDFLKSIDPSPLFNYSGMWSSELCGEYMAKVALEVTSGGELQAREELTASFICECPPPPGECTGTPGYWKNHRDMWPVDELTVGGQLFTRAELMEIFNWPARHDKRIKLFHHLVAAKLNVLRGATYEGIDGAISDADDFLAMYPLGSEIDKATERMIEGLKAPLEMFNESAPCGETIDSYESDVIMFGASPDDDREEKTWGGIKSIYRK
ncbi:MAG: hypothetical protein R6U43_01855 [Candidatus Krumholzibacteriales bacterium]